METPVSYPILQPAIVLVLWSLLVLLWMSAVRIPALRRANLDLRNVGGRGPDLNGVLPDQVQWKSHNYNHLMEQPTLFYAVVLVLALGSAQLTSKAARLLPLPICCTVR